MKKVLIADYEPLPPLSEQYSVKYMEKNKLIRLGSNDEGLPVIGICSPHDESLVDEISEFHRSNVEFVEIDNEDFTIYLGRELSKVGNHGNSGVSSSKIEIGQLSDDAPIINLVNSIFIDAIRKHASDIHIEGKQDSVLIRYRIDGVLVPVMEYEAEYFSPVSSRIKIMADLNIMERRLPQDGRISVSIAGVDLDMRLSIVPISGGESIVLRIFNRKGSLLGLNELGFSENVKSDILHLQNQPHGLVLFTGPTGSGKTTSLNAIIQGLEHDVNKIITIEDPIEYKIDGVNQIQTNEEIGLTFHSLLRRVLRQDPNIIMIGEIRDSETAQLAVRAALTGHLVLSSLHTNDSVSSVQRLINMGVESYLLAAVLRGVIAQRLVRVLCPKCKTIHKLSPGEKRLYTDHNLDPDFIYKHTGCSCCNFTGYSGRTTIAESFVATSELEELIVRNVPNSMLVKQLNNENFISLIENGLLKTIEGTTDLNEIERVL